MGLFKQTDFHRNKKPGQIRVFFESPTLIKLWDRGAYHQTVQELF